MIDPTLAVVFPGQGSQSVGMLATIANQFSEVQQLFAEASDILHYDLWQLVECGPALKLNQTIHTQPALLTASCAIWRLLQAKQLMQPKYLAGHSLGEYTALVCAGALDFSDAVTLVAARGQYMQEAVSEDEGAMAAIIGLDKERVNEICKKAIQNPKEVLSPANFNDTGQIVIAGHKPAVLRAVVLSKEQGAKLAVLIPISVPSHCELMKPASERLARLLKNVKLRLPIIPILNNVDVQYYGDTDSIRDGLVRQLYMPVRWVEIIQAFVKEGITKIVECGPGKVLTGLNKRMDKNLQCLTTMDVLKV